jgi:hypothetical protein
MIQEPQTMLRWLFVAMHLLAEAGAARRETRIRCQRFLEGLLRHCYYPQPEPRPITSTLDSFNLDRAP